MNISAPDDSMQVLSLFIIPHVTKLDPVYLASKGSITSKVCNHFTPSSAVLTIF